MPEPYLKLYCPVGKGVCLEWYFPDTTNSREFAEYIYDNRPSKGDMFHQGGSHNMDGGWHLFEFWNFDRCQQEVIDLAKNAAKTFGKTLIVDL